MSNAKLIGICLGTILFGGGAGHAQRMEDVKSRLTQKAAIHAASDVLPRSGPRPSSDYLLPSQSSTSRVTRSAST